MVAANAASSNLENSDIEDKPFYQGKRLAFNALLMIDSTTADGVYTKSDITGESSVRRLRVGVDSELSQNLATELSIDLDPSTSSIDVHKASSQFSFGSDQHLEVGLMKQPFGLEHSSGSKKLRTLERSVASDTFSPARGYGLVFDQNSSNSYFAIGAFLNPERKGSQEISARLTWSPVHEKRHVVHVGTSVNYINDGNEEFQLKSTGSVDSGRKIIKSDEFNTSSITSLGVEGAWSKGSFSLQSELFRQSLSLRDSAEADAPVFTGGYIQAGWVFNNGYRKYKGSGFGKIAGTGKSRNTELVASFSSVDVRHNESGEQAQELTIGVNYQVNSTFRFSAQAHKAVVLNDKRNTESGRGVQLRFVVDL